MGLVDDVSGGIESIQSIQDRSFCTLLKNEVSKDSSRTIYILLANYSLAGTSSCPGNTYSR